MEIIQKKNETEQVSNHIGKLGIGILFMNKENQKRAKEILQKLGIKTKSKTENNQQLHPEYIIDYEGEIGIGLGNIMYKTYFKKLYVLIRNDE